MKILKFVKSEIVLMICEYIDLYVNIKYKLCQAKKRFLK